MSVLLFALIASVQEPSRAMAIFDCHAADATHEKAAVVGLYPPATSDDAGDKVRVLVEPVSGFDDSAAFELTNVEIMRLRNDPADPNSGSFLRIASGMGGEGGRSPWRIDITIDDEAEGEQSIIATLRTYKGAVRDDYPMNCTMREGQSQ